MRAKIIFGVVVLAIAAGVAGVWLMPKKLKAGPWRLADGSELSLAGVTYGKKHEMRYGGGVVDYLYPVLTPDLRKKLGCKVAVVAPSDSNAIVIWFWDKNPAMTMTMTSGVLSAGLFSFGGNATFAQTSYKIKGGATKYMPIYYVATRDEHGMESATPCFPNTTVVWHKTNVLLGLELDLFPRRSKEFGIRIYRSDEPSRTVVEFKIPNPMTTHYPVWTAAPVPTIVRTNGLEVSLTALGPGQDTPGNNFEVRSGTRADFSLKEGGQTSTNWHVLQAEAISASGESRVVRPDQWRQLRPYPDWYYHDPISAFFPGTLWQEEPAWKIKVELGRRANFPVEEIWRVKGITVPAPGETREINLKTNIYGVEIELMAINNNNSSVVGRGMVIPAFTALHMRAAVPVPGMHLRLIAAKDDQLRNVSFSQNDFDPIIIGGPTAAKRKLEQSCIINVPPHAETVDVTLAYTKSVFVEFLARPTVTKDEEGK